jgi:hypothetical protein
MSKTKELTKKPAAAKAHRKTKVESRLFQRHQARICTFSKGFCPERREFVAYHELDRPQTPLASAFQMELVAQLLSWIGEQGFDNLSPCLIASKAAGVQEAWDKARNAAP